MASSVVGSWLMGACMPVARENESLTSITVLSSNLSFSSRFNKWVVRKKKRDLGIPKCDSEISGIRYLMSSCSSFESCDNFYRAATSPSAFTSYGLSSSPFLYGNSVIPLLGRRRSRLRQPPHSGQVMSVAVQPAMEVAPKKKPSMKQRRVVVTGMGVETPLGSDPNVFYTNLLEGVSGITEIEAFDCSNFSTRIAGEIKYFSADGYVAPKLSKRMDKFMLYMLTAGKKALVDGGVTADVMDELNKSKCGVLIGSAMGGMKVFSDSIEALRISYRKMNPFCVPFATTNMGSAMLAMDLGWMGPNYSISTACATSNFCILNAANHIIRGEADMMLCGGSDAVIIPIGLGGFVACKALSQRNNDPTKASRPWDSNRDGFVMGEGSGVLLLEELEHAKRRGADIYAEFLGGAFTCDAYHMTEPHPNGSGVILCIEKALALSGVAKEDVNYINAHATSTPTGDIKEFQALLHCFGQNRELRVNSTKSMIGHLLGAAGAVEAVATVQAIRSGWVHPNINLENPDDGVDPNVLVGSKKEELNIKVALSNSFGFGGQNSSILFAPYK